MTSPSTRLAALTLISIVTACAGSSASNGTRVATAPAAPPPPRPFEYAASTGQYRFTSNGKVVQSMMGQTRDIDNLNSRVVTIALARSAPDTMTLSLTVDSITSTNSMGMPTMGLDKVLGSKFTAKIAPNGSFYSATGPKEAENALAAGMTDEMGRAMPRIRAILATGATWTDTLKDQVKQNGLEVSREIITKYSVLGDSVVAGESSWKLAREMSIKGTGKGAMQGQDIALESSGAGKGVLLVSKKGVLMAGSGEETSVGNVTLTANGMQITLNSTTKTAFTKIK